MVEHVVEMDQLAGGMTLRMEYWSKIRVVRGQRVETAVLTEDRADFCQQLESWVDVQDGGEPWMREKRPMVLRNELLSCQNWVAQHHTVGCESYMTRKFSGARSVATTKRFLVPSFTSK